MNFADYVELEKRAEAHGAGDDTALAQLLHIIQFKETVVRGHKRTMRDLNTWGEEHREQCRAAHKGSGGRMITDEEKREAVEFLRSGTCLYFEEHRKRQLDCSRCMKVSTMLFGHYDALCGLDSCGTDTWQRLADLIEGKN
ncbi:MAG: hypothetical protein [Bacteriophage sp.]|nr:MAG: hypothetical protein [Bacteriophage sp.]